MVNAADARGDRVAQRDHGIVTRDIDVERIGLRTEREISVGNGSSALQRNVGERDVPAHAWDNAARSRV